MSFKPGMKVRGESGLNFNSLRFETEQEAIAYARDLYSRWTMTTGYEIVPSDDPVNYRFTAGRLEATEVAQCPTLNSLPHMVGTIRQSKQS